MPEAHWVGTWASAPLASANKSGLFAQDTTLRQTVRVSIGGHNVRIVLSNEFGEEPLTVGGAQIALPATQGAILSGTGRSLTFGGQSSIEVPPGAVVLSDPLALNVAPLSDLTISLFLPAQTLGILTQHNSAQATSYRADGNQLDAVSLSTPHPFTSWLFLKSVDIQAPAFSKAVVAFGDSITDGYKSTMDANARWPDELARRLESNKTTSGVAVLNAGISGNRILHSGPGGGPSALSRFNRDVIDQSGVGYVILLEGINDIGHMHTAADPQDVSVQQLIVGMKQLIERAHAHGIKIFGATLTPDENAHYGRAADREAMREALNEFIRNSGKFDGVIDFDKATRDPAHPTFLLPAYDSGDHLHPGDAGYKAMGDAIDLKLFTK